MGEIPTKPRKLIKDKEATNDEILLKLDSMEEKFSKLEESVTALRVYLIGDVNGGNGEKIGLGERVRIIETWMKTRTWLERTFVGVFIAEAVAFIYLVIRVVVEHVPLIVK